MAEAARFTFAPKTSAASAAIVERRMRALGIDPAKPAASSAANGVSVPGIKDRDPHNARLAALAAVHAVRALRLPLFKQ
jgi:hypothetical protein